jgi:hypothetical protein
MTTYEVTIQLSIGSLDIEVEFEDGQDPTDDEIHDAAIREIELELGRSKLAYYRAR